MCGLAGIYNIASERQIDRHELNAMIKILNQRGPDGYGYRDIFQTNTNR